MTLRTNKIFLAVCLGILIFLMILPLPAAAEDNNPVGFLNIFYLDEDTALSGAQFSMYCLGTISEDNHTFTVSPAFEGYNVSIQIKDSSQWRDLATTLEGYILRDDIDPAVSGQTDQFGRLTFPFGSEQTKKGLYLVLGTRHTQGDYAYESVPTIIILPGESKARQATTSNFTMKPKFTRSFQNNSSPENLEVKALKVWKDDGYVQIRPSQISVQLLCNGEIYDTVILSKDNNWVYTWTGLNQDCSWCVAEQNPKGYTVSVSRENHSFVITNTYAGSEEVLPDASVPTETTQPSATLTQSGQLWWPAPVLFALGIALIFLGIILRRGNEDD